MKNCLNMDQPGNPAKEDGLEEEILVYMQEIPNHPSCFQFSPNVRAHLHSGQCP